MRKLMISRGLLIALALTCVPYASAQPNNGLPAAQPKHLTIIREQVKVGHSAGHAKHEAGWPAAFAKANSPDYYIAITSITGPTEAWYLSPSESYTAEAASMKRDAKNKELSTELDRLALADAEFINNSTTIQLLARPDLSLGKFPNVAKVRFFEISIFSAKPGHEEQVDAMIKAYGAVRKRVSPDASYRIYNVAAGMPDGNYVVVTSVEDYGEFDRTMAENDKVFASTTPEEKAIFDKWGEAVDRSITNRYRVDPVQSYVSKEVRASDPEFWNAK